jgi:hypothetical protein
MSTAQVHIAEQAELTNPIPYEVRLQARILKCIRKEPGITPVTLQHRVGFCLTPVYESILAHLIEDGVVLSSMSKVSLSVAE